MILDLRLNAQAGLKDLRFMIYGFRLGPQADPKMILDL